MKDRLTIVAILSAVLLAAFMTVAFLPKFELDINEQCEPKGLDSRLKASMQGQRFWIRQLRYLERAIEDMEAIPGKVQELERTVRSTFAWMDSVNEDLYRRFPEMRPTPREAAARHLQREAESIERVEGFRQMELMSREFMRPLLACRSRLVARANRSE